MRLIRKTTVANDNRRLLEPKRSATTEMNETTLDSTIEY